MSSKSFKCFTLLLIFVSERRSYLICSWMMEWMRPGCISKPRKNIFCFFDSTCNMLTANLSFAKSLGRSQEMFPVLEGHENSIWTLFNIWKFWHCAYITQILQSLTQFTNFLNTTSVILNFYCASIGWVGIGWKSSKVLKCNPDVADVVVHVDC